MCKDSPDTRSHTAAKDTLHFCYLSQWNAFWELISALQFDQCTFLTGPPLLLLGHSGMHQGGGAYVWCPQSSVDAPRSAPLCMDAAADDPGNPARLINAAANEEQCKQAASYQCCNDEMEPRKSTS